MEHIQKYRLVIGVFILLYIPLCIKAQVLKISPENTREYFYLPNYPYFNEAFIRRNKIREIRVQYSYKPDGKVIVDNKNEELYRFDSAGVLVYQEQIIQIPYTQSMDTTRIECTYNAHGQITEAKKTHKKNTSIHCYTYQKDTLYTHQFYTRSAEDQKTLLIYEESFETKKNDRGFERTTKNDGGKAYKIERYEFLEGAYLKSYSEALLFNNNGTRTEYSYDLMQRIDKKEVYTLPEQKMTESTQYVYDQINLIQEIKSESGIVSYKKEFIYKDNLLLNAILVRDERIQSIKILKFSYTFW